MLSTCSSLRNTNQIKLHAQPPPSALDESERKCKTNWGIDVPIKSKLDLLNQIKLSAFHSAVPTSCLRRNNMAGRPLCSGDVFSIYSSRGEPTHFPRIAPSSHPYGNHMDSLRHSHIHQTSCSFLLPQEKTWAHLFISAITWCILLRGLKPCRPNTTAEKHMSHLYTQNIYIKSKVTQQS